MKVKEIFRDNKKRKLATLVLLIPFFIVIAICGVKIYQQAKNIMGLASEEVDASSDAKYSINNGNFVLRDNATDLQKTYFAELKGSYEGTTTLSDEEMVVLTIKNFVADFYTWSNKAGQYDVGGMYYLYTPQRKTIYIQVRDQFNKYLNEYINEYGTKNLLEVESVEAMVDGGEFVYTLEIAGEDGETTEEEVSAYKAHATWTYVSKEGKFDSSKYDTSSYFVVINNNGRYEIIYMGNKEYAHE